VSIDNNICTAKLHRGVAELVWFYNQVQTGCPWDYKNKYGPQYADFGNFNYGATGKALELSDLLLLRAAGWQQEGGRNYKPKDGHWWWLPPYGDDPNDQTMIKAGINYYYLSNGQTMCVP
jgi:hypothetical protein